MPKWQRVAILMGMGCVLAATPAFAKDDRVSFASDITVASGSTSGDLVCLLCNVKVHGDVAGDVVAILGSVTVDDQRSISGDLVCLLCNVKVHGDVAGDVVAILGSVTVDDQRSISGDLVTVGGDATLGNEASVHGDAAVVAGDLVTGPEASIGGERSVVQGRGWLLLPLAPLAILIGIVWLIVWFTRRNRYRFPMYPLGRGF